VPLDYTRMREQAARLDQLTPVQVKVLEQRARRMAERQGLVLSRSRRRDPHAIDYGRYFLLDAQTNTHVAGAENGRARMTLADVVEFLLTRSERAVA
jgi:hypothetical protein